MSTFSNFDALVKYCKKRDLKVIPYCDPEGMIKIINNKTNAWIDIDFFHWSDRQIAEAIKPLLNVHYNDQK